MPSLKILFFLLLPLAVFSQSYGLKSLIQHANTHNENIHAKALQSKAKMKEVDAQKSAYWPTVDAGASYSKVNPNTLVAPGQTTSGYISVGVDLYDGGRKNALKKAKEFEYEASLFEKKAFEKSVTLDIVNRFYTVRKYQANLHALREKEKDLSAQIKRMKKFEVSGLAMEDDVYKLQAVYDDNQYNIESLKLAIITGFDNLELQSGMSVSNLKKSYLKEPKHIGFEPFESIKIMDSNVKALQQNANAIDAGYKPQLRVENTYNKSKYSDLADSGFGGDILPDHQNKLQFSVNMRLFDNGKMKKEREAVQYQKLALQSENSHMIREQKMNFGLAKKQMRTILSQLKSAKSGLRAAQSSYRTLKKQYEEGLVDNITYLDALSDKSAALSRVKEVAYDYEISKSIYYYYAGKDPKEFIK